MNDFSCHSNTFSLYPMGKTKPFKVWWNELTQLDLCWASSNWFSFLSSIDFMVHPQLVFFSPYEISLIINNKLAASEGIKVHRYFLSLRQMKSWLYYYFIWLHCLSYTEWCPVESRSVNLDINIQLFYLMISMLRTSCGTAVHAPAAAECPTADECRCCFPHPSGEPKYMLISCQFTQVFLSGIYFPDDVQLNKGSWYWDNIKYFL